MTAMTTEARSFLPHGRELTRADLDRLPDDGHRYELIDGVLVVTPAPRVSHQTIAGNLYLLLRAAASGGLVVLFAPVDVVLAENTVLQPDLVVAPKDAFTEKDLPVAPLLAVEVLSPSTRGIDLLLKKEPLERAGCQYYWVVDPEPPSVTAWRLVGGAYQQVAHVVGAELFEVDAPFAVSFAPASLVG